MDHIRGAVQIFLGGFLTLLVDLLALAATHPCLSFAWVNREANHASHELAGWSLRNRFWSSFDISFGPFSMLV
jgi:hypothetical protein